MENSYRILDLFPTPLLQTNLPSKFSSIQIWLDSQPLRKSENSKNFGDISESTYILDSKECLDLKKYILKYALKFGSEYMGYNYKEYRFSQSWISHKYPNQSHLPHIHSNSTISGIIYYGEFFENTPSIIFHKNNNIPSNVNVIQHPKNTDTLNPYNSEGFSYIPSPGTLLLFPSYLQHSVPLNTTNKVRKSLAFNIVPKEGFGSEEDLTELKFN